MEAQQRPLRNCVLCGETKPHAGKGLCLTCAQRERRRTHPGEDAAYSRKYRDHNGEKVREAKQRYNEGHRDEARERVRQWRELNRERHREATRQWASRHPEAHKLNTLRWRKNNPARLREHGRVADHRRRARQHALPATLTTAQWLQILEGYGNCCAYCGKGGMKLTQDHVVPVSKGGGTTADNIVPACKPCNSKKGARLPLKPLSLRLLL